MPQFEAVLAQLKHENMASLVSSIRQSIESVVDKDFSFPETPPWYGCSVSHKPLNGSYNLAYRASFDDGTQWILKIPANGHHACFDNLAAEALTSEALTMRLIKQATTIPIPTVHHFDASFNNDIGCPYILMDFLEGKPLWQGWFDEGCSRSAVEQFRARALQTIATAMVQLSQFSVYRGGFLRFNCDGQPVDVAAARVPDWLTGHDVQQGLKTVGEGCLYCEKGPIVDPASAFLFMLNRRGVRQGDGPLEWGTYDIVRLFTEWTLEKATTANGTGRQFVLAHPDFDIQNFLVEDDGTLCGIIDWDGVAAVPLSVGCLKYPEWLMGDWHPRYNYCPGSAGQQASSREELAAYRTMYAQFVEAFSTISCASSKVGKQNADITRGSLIAGCLDIGAQDPKLTTEMLGILFRELESLTADGDDGDTLDTDPESTIETGTDDVKEEHSNKEIAPTETEDSICVDQKDKNTKSTCSETIAELAPPSSPSNVLETSDRTRLPTLQTDHLEGSIIGQEYELAYVSSSTLTKEINWEPEASTSRKARVAKWALSLGERGSKRAAKALHKKETTNSKPRKVKSFKWALNSAQKWCKGASEALHKKEDAFGLHPEDGPQITAAQNGSWSISKALTLAAGFCKPTKILQRNIATRMPPNSVPRNEESASERTMTKRIRNCLRWLTTLVKKSNQKLVEIDISDLQTSAAAKKRSLTDLASADVEYSQRSNFGQGSRGHEGLDSKMYAMNNESENIWASIASEIDKEGISIETIKKRRDVIVECIIHTLDKDIQQEKALRRHNKAAKKEKKARNQAWMKAKNKTSTLDSLLYPALLGSDLIKSSPTKAGQLGSDVAFKEAHFDAIGRNHAQNHSGERGTLKSESLISKLEAAKERFDLEMATKGKESKSVTPRSRTSVALVAQLEFPKLQEPAHDVTTMVATEEAKRKLWLMLFNYAKPKATSTNPDFGSNRALGYPRAAIEEVKPTKLGPVEKNLDAMESTKQKLRKMLSSLQEPEPVNQKLRNYMYQVRESNYGVYESNSQSHMQATTSVLNAGSKIVTAQNPTNFKGGRWVETPGGTLKRMEDEEVLPDKLYEQKPISKSRQYGLHACAVEGPQSQRVNSNNQRFKVDNISQAPDIDGDDEVYGIGESTNNENNLERDRLEDGKIREEILGSVDSERKMIDKGNFNPAEICIALGNGNLDEKRMMRLQKGFMALLDDAVGRYRR